MEEAIIGVIVAGLSSYLGWLTGQINNSKMAIVALKTANEEIVRNQNKIEKSIDKLNTQMGLFEDKIMDRLTELQKEMHNYMMSKK